MTPEQIKTLIAGDPEAAALAAAGDDAGCKARCEAIAPPVSVMTRRTYLSLAAATGIGIAATRRLVVSVRAVATLDPLVDELQVALRRSTDAEGIDVSDVGTQAMLSQMASLNTDGGLTAEDVDAIKALCFAPQVIAADEVSAAMKSSRGNA